MISFLMIKEFIFLFVTMITCGFLADFVIVRKPKKYTRDEDKVGYYDFKLRRKMERKNDITDDLISHAIGVVWGTIIMIPAFFLYGIQNRSVLFAISCWILANAIVHSVTDQSDMNAMLIIRLIQIIVTDILLVCLINIWLAKG